MTVPFARYRAQPGVRKKGIYNSTYNIIGLFFLIILFFYGFFLGRNSIPVVTGEPAEAVFWRVFQERTGKKGWIWVTGEGDKEAFHLTYRPWGEDHRYTLGKVPLVAAVNFWNSINGLTRNQLAAIISGEIT